MDNKTEFEELIQQISNKHTKTIWQSEPKRLTCCLVEPRDHKCLAGILNNIANIYANCEVWSYNIPFAKKLQNA